MGADRIFVGGRDGFLYCFNADGSSRWRHRVGHQSSDPMEMKAPYQVTVNMARGEVLYASWGMIRALDLEGRERWHLGKRPSRGLGDYGLLVDRFDVGRRGDLVIQRRNLRVSLRLPNGEMKSLMGGFGELEIKGIDWQRGRFWARSGEGLVIVDLSGSVGRHAADTGMGWAHPAALRDDGRRLVTWRQSQFQLWDDELEQVGTGEVVGETISVAAFAPEGEVILGTSRRVLRVTGDATS